MWYFTWVLGVGFAIFLAILNALWMENAEARKMALLKPEPSAETTNIVNSLPANPVRAQVSWIPLICAVGIMIALSIYPDF